MAQQIFPPFFLMMCIKWTVFLSKFGVLLKKVVAKSCNMHSFCVIIYPFVCKMHVYDTQFETIMSFKWEYIFIHCQNNIRSHYGWSTL
jgi:hypothetical protein